MYMENWRLFMMGLYVVATTWIMYRQTETIDKLTDSITRIKKGESK